MRTEKGDHADKVVLAETGKEKPQSDSATLREISYAVIFIAAVFAVNAMETGSYRTPWPVAIATLLIGLGLFVYSRRLEKRSKS